MALQRSKNHRDTEFTESITEVSTIHSLGDEDDLLEHNASPVGSADV